MAAATIRDRHANDNAKSRKASAMSRYGRKAFGHQRIMSPSIKARNVAESIYAHTLDPDAPETLARYGLVADSEQHELVRKAWCQLYDADHQPQQSCWRV